MKAVVFYITNLLTKKFKTMSYHNSIKNDFFFVDYKVRGFLIFLLGFWFYKMVIWAQK